MHAYHTHRRTYHTHARISHRHAKKRNSINVDYINFEEVPSASARHACSPVVSLSYTSKRGTFSATPPEAVSANRGEHESICRSLEMFSPRLCEAASLSLFCCLNTAGHLERNAWTSPSPCHCKQCCNEHTESTCS